MKLHRYVDHQRLHIVTKDVISLSISVLLLFRHYISHKITFGAPSSGGVLRSACGAFIDKILKFYPLYKHSKTAPTYWGPCFSTDEYNLNKLGRGSPKDHFLPNYFQIGPVGSFLKRF